MPIVAPKMLRVSNMSAAHLEKRSDPYCKVLVGGREVGRTDILMNNKDPVWFGEAFHITIYDVEHTELSLEVWDRDLLSEDDFLGKLDISPRSLVQIKADNVVHEHS